MNLVRESRFLQDLRMLSFSTIKEIQYHIEQIFLLLLQYCMLLV